MTPTTKPTKELERLFGPDWPEVIDELEGNDPMLMTYRQPVEILGFSYRHGEMCAYIAVEGERKTIPLSDIHAIEHEIFSEEDE